MKNRDNIQIFTILLAIGGIMACVMVAIYYLLIFLQEKLLITGNSILIIKNSYFAYSFLGFGILFYMLIFSGLIRDNTLEWLLEGIEKSRSSMSSV